MSSASVSDSVEEFCDSGNWWTVAGTAGGAVVNAVTAYSATKSSTTTVYRSVSESEAKDIKSSGKFNISATGMDAKQFGFSLEETRQFGNRFGQSAIVSVEVPNKMLSQLCTIGVDTTIFRSGTLTVSIQQLDMFNQAVCGTIKFIP